MIKLLLRAGILLVSVRGEGDSTPEGTSDCRMMHFGVSGCSEANLKYIAKKARALADMDDETDSEDMDITKICSGWPDPEGCGSEDKPCPMRAWGKIKRNGDETEFAQCGDIIEITSKSGSVFGQVSTHVDEDVGRKPEFGLASQGWSKACPFSCKDGKEDTDNCYATEDQCTELGGVMTQTFDQCACIANECIDDLYDAIKDEISKKVSDPFDEIGSINRCNHECCETCVTPPASANEIYEGHTGPRNSPVSLRHTGYKWVKKVSMGGAFSVTASVAAAAMCVL